MFAEVGLVVRNCSVILRLVAWTRFSGQQRASRDDFQLDVDFDDMDALGAADHCGAIDEVSIVMMPAMDSEADTGDESDENAKRWRGANGRSLTKMPPSGGQLLDL